MQQADDADSIREDKSQTGKGREFTAANEDSSSGLPRDATPARPGLLAKGPMRRLILARDASQATAAGSSWADAWSRVAGTTCEARCGGLLLMWSRNGKRRAERMALLMELRASPKLASEVIRAARALHQAWDRKLGLVA